MEENNIVCKCKGVSEETIVNEIKKGSKTLKEIKNTTKAGTGVCCGIRCNKIIKNLIKENE